MPVIDSKKGFVIFYCGCYRARGTRQSGFSQFFLSAGPDGESDLFAVAIEQGDTRED